MKAEFAGCFSFPCQQHCSPEGITIGMREVKLRGLLTWREWKSTRSLSGHSSEYPTTSLRCTEPTSQNGSRPIGINPCGGVVPICPHTLAYSLSLPITLLSTGAQCFLRFSHLAGLLCPWTSGLRAAWEPVRNAESQAHLTVLAHILHWNKAPR